MASWKKVIVSGSDAELTSVTASSGIIVGSNLINAVGESSLTASLFGTASWATNALNAPAAFPYTGSARITGSLTVIGPVTISGSLKLSGSMYNREIHVSVNSGDDTNGDGSLLAPFRTITKAFATVGSTGEAVVIHPGTYVESPTLTSLNVTVASAQGEIGGICFINGTVTINGATSSTRLQGLAIASLVHSGAGNLYLDSCQINTSFTKSGGGYFEAIESEVTGINVTGTAQSVFNSGKQTGLTVNNAGATVSVVGSLTTTDVTVTAGTFAAVNAVVYSATIGGNAITSAVGTFVQLNNSNMVQSNGTPARIAISGLLGYDDIQFDLANSTLGTSLATIADFQRLRATQITGSLFGTASWSQNSLTASVATSASVAQLAYSGTGSFTGSFNGEVVANSLIATGSLNGTLYGIGSGSFSGSFFGDGSGLTGIAATLDVSASSGQGISIDLKTQDLTIAGTANQITTSGSGQTITIGLPADVIIDNSLIVQGDLTVNGTTTTINTQNLAVEDQFILIASGSTGVDAGLVVDNGGGTGPVLSWDSSETRWGLTGSFSATQTTVAPDAYLSAVITADNPYYAKVGNIKVENGNIFIYV
jgi:hypothetical protein